MKSKSGEEIKITDVDLNYVFDSRDGEKGFCLNWDSNIGFGQMTFIKTNDSGCTKLFVETEAMSDNNDKRFIKEVLNKFIEELEVIE